MRFGKLRLNFVPLWFKLKPMKYLKIIMLLLVLNACSSSQSISSFYNKHKNDANVTAIQVPQFMLATVKNLNPEFDSLLGTIDHLRYISISSKNKQESTSVSNSISKITNKKYIEIFRSNEEAKRTVVSAREKKEVLQEIVVYSTTGLKNSILYFKGEFNPEKIKNLATKGTFTNFSDALQNQYLNNNFTNKTPGFNPNPN